MILGSAAASGGGKTLLIESVKALSTLAIPFFLSFFPLYAALRGIKVYEEFVDGAKEGFGVAVRIIPYLVTILVAVGMFRGANGMELIATKLDGLFKFFNFPPELFSLAFMRPLSGSGSIALVSDIIHTYGPDHIFSMMAGTILGSTETTFYVLAVYFGSVGIRRARHAVAAGLIADVVGILASVAICRMMFSS
jgi:spore maturation protein B